MGLPMRCIFSFAPLDKYLWIVRRGGPYAPRKTPEGEASQHIVSIQEGSRRLGSGRDRGGGVPECAFQNNRQDDRQTIITGRNDLCQHSRIG